MPDRSADAGRRRHDAGYDAVVSDLQRAEHTRPRQRNTAERQARVTVRGESAGRAREHERLPADDDGCRRRGDVRGAVERAERDVLVERIERRARRSRRLRQRNRTTFTANDLPGGYPVVATSVDGSITFQLVNTASGVAATIAPIAPARQSAPVSGRYGSRLQVQVLDATGVPVVGATVSFALGAGAGQGGAGAGADSAGASFVGGSTQVSAVTNVFGIAISPPFSADSTAGRFTATATTAGVVDPASFALDNLAGKPPRLVPLGRSHQSATVGEGYSDPLQVKLTTNSGKPVQGATVTFTLAAAATGAGAGAGPGANFAGGSTQASETTDAAGIATSPGFAANSTAGSFVATAAATGVTNPASFSLDNLAGKPPSARVVGPHHRSALVGTSYRQPLEIKVTAANGKPVQGLAVTFSLGSSGAGASAGADAGASFLGGSAQATETTDAAGIVRSPRFEANTTAGTFTAAASITGS